MSPHISRESLTSLPRTLGAADRSPDVVELKQVREAKQAAAAVSGWACTVCDLAAVGFTVLEAAFLARIHDQVMHGSTSTASVHDDRSAAEAV